MLLILAVTNIITPVIKHLYFDQVYKSNYWRTKMKTISTVLFAATIAVASTAASAWGWGNNGYNNGYGNGYGDGSGDFDGDASFGFNMSGSASGRGRGYGNGYNGYRGYNGYGYAPYGAPYGYAPVAAPVAATAPVAK